MPPKLPIAAIQLAVIRPPLSHIPRGPRRKPREPEVTFLGCPRLSPEWELSALRALMKPQTRGPILHRSSLQAWPRDATTRVMDLCRIVGERLACTFDPQFPIAGDYFLIVRIEPAQIDPARALGLLLSREFPDVWFALDRLLTQNGKFFRRKKGFKLEIAPANNVHLPRAVRTALRGVGL